MHRALRRLAERALAHWSTTARVGRRLSHGENTIYAVDGPPWVLRLHRDDYHPTAAIESELVVLDGLREAGFRVGRPQPMAGGDRALTLDGRRITVLEHVPGRHAIRRLGRGRARVLGATLRALQRGEPLGGPSTVVPAFSQGTADERSLTSQVTEEDGTCGIAGASGRRERSGSTL